MNNGRVDIALQENNAIIASRAKRVTVALFKSKRTTFGVAVLAFFLILAILGRFIAPYNPLIQSGPLWSPPSESHLFGTNYLGQDVLSWFIIGTATSLWVGVSVAFFSALIGVSVGLTAGYFGKYTDEVLMRFVDMLLVIPAFPLLVILSAYLPPTTNSTILILSVLSWPFMSRVVRSQVLSLKERGFVTASKLAGESRLKIMFKDILPNMLPIIFINIIYLVIGAIVAQAGLAFFGLGNINSINWGTMLYWAQIEDAAIQNAWWWIIPPGLAIGILGLGLNMLANGISDMILLNQGR
ncbi:MAG: ABC transporter permease [Candidatus Thermoplasmatota archaeon]|nr:ABC transporter permease [Candidatus Thermoplasmatota archaeon]